MRKLPRTYIFPTGFGFAFGGMALVLLMMAMGYANNLIYLSAFALISVAFCSMYVTNENVRRLTMSAPRVGVAFAQEPCQVLVSLTNSSSQDSTDVLLSLRKTPSHSSLTFCPARKTTVIPVSWIPRGRGLVTLPRVTLQSDFPFGLLRSWKYQQALDPVIVYPARRGDPQFPSSEISGKDRGNLGLFRDHRSYQSTDSPRRVDWRATAKYQELLVKNFEGAEKAPLNFHWDQTRHLSLFEDRLSQLSLWLSRAEELGFSYSLTLKSFQSGESEGEAHLRLCLETLALLQESGSEG